MEKKTATKASNLIGLCQMGLSCCQRTVHVTQWLTCTFI